MKLLLVVHRYAPFPGGSEIYVRNIAEELRERGHDVTVLAQTHNVEALLAGHYNGVKVISDHNVLINVKWDLIIVHGGDVGSQNTVHAYADQIPSKVLYLLIKPSESPTCLNGLKKHAFIGCSTLEDDDHCAKHDVWLKRRKVRHGIRLSESLGKDLSARKHPQLFYKHDKSFLDPEAQFQAVPKTFVSVGGFWPHKGMQELAEIFHDVFKERPEYSLELYGYDCPHLAPHIPNSNVRTIFGAPREKIMEAIANAELYIMNSTEEGFGLVLLEASVNRTPWIARNIAGARVLQHGAVYDNIDSLKSFLGEWEEHAEEAKARAARADLYVRNNHLIRHTVNDIEAVLSECKK